MATLYGVCMIQRKAFCFERWRYKETLEISGLQIKLIRIGSVFGMVIVTIYLIVVTVQTFAPSEP